MHKHFLTFSIALFLHACTANRAATVMVQDPNDPVSKAVDTLATALFDQGQPAVNAAVAQLPPEVQALAQAAYVALEEAVKRAADAGVDALTDQAALAAQNARDDLASVANILHDTIHDTNTVTILPPPQEGL